MTDSMQRPVGPSVVRRRRINRPLVYGLSTFVMLSVGLASGLAIVKLNAVPVEEYLRRAEAALAEADALEAGQSFPGEKVAAIMDKRMEAAANFNYAYREDNTRLELGLKAFRIALDTGFAAEANQTIRALLQRHPDFLEAQQAYLAFLTDPGLGYDFIFPAGFGAAAERGFDVGVTARNVAEKILSLTDGKDLHARRTLTKLLELASRNSPPLVPEAQESARKLKEDFPNDHVATLLLAYMLEGRQPTAERRAEADELLKALEENLSDNEQAARSLLQYFLVTQRIDQARALALKLAEKDIKSPELIFVLSEALAIRRSNEPMDDDYRERVRKAEELCRVAISRDPLRSEFFERLAELGATSGDVDRAIAPLDEALARPMPAERSMFHKRAVIFAARLSLLRAGLLLNKASQPDLTDAQRETFFKRMEQDLLRFRETVDRQTGYRREVEQTGRMSQFHYLTGMIAMGRNDLPTAQRQLNAAVDQLRRVGQAIPADIYFRLGIAHRALGQMGLALENFINLERLQPNNPVVLRMVGETVLSLPPDPLMVQRAVAFAERLVALTPEDSSAKKLHVMLLARAGRDPEANMLMQRYALADDADFNLALLGVRTESPNTLVVEQALQQLTRLRPDDADPLVKQAVFLATTGRWEEALKLARDALARFPDDDGLAAMAVACDLSTPIADRVSRLAARTGTASRLSQVAELYLRTGRLEDTIAMTEAQHRMQPDSISARRLLGWALQRGDTARAEELATQIEQRNWDGAGGKLARGGMLLARGDVERATLLLREAVNLFPGSAEARRLLGQALSRQNSLLEAREQFEQALRSNPAEVDALRGMIDISVREQKIAEAAALVERAIVLAPADRVFRVMRVELMELNNPQQALQERERMAREDPDNLQNIERLLMLLQRDDRLALGEPYIRDLITRRPEDPAVLRMQARFLTSMGQPDRADDVMSKALATAKNDEERANVLFERIELRAASGMIEEASKDVAELLRLFPDRAIAHAQHARFLDAIGEHDKARAAYRKACDAKDAQINQFDLYMTALIRQRRNDDAARLAAEIRTRFPGHPQIPLFDAYVAMAENDLARAVSIYSEFLRKEPNNITALYSRSRAHYARRELQLAMADLTRLRQIAPAAMNHQPRIELAYMLLADGNRDSAQRELEQCHAEVPANTNVANALVDVYMRTEQYSLAEQIVQRMQRRFPNQSAWPMQLGRLQIAQRRNAQALDAFDAALRLNAADLNALDGRVNALLRLGRWDQARQAIETLRAAAPKAAENWEIVHWFAIGDAPSIDQRIKPDLANAVDGLASISQIEGQLASVLGERARSALAQWTAASRLPGMSLLGQAHALLTDAAAAADPQVRNRGMQQLAELGEQILATPDIALAVRIGAISARSRAYLSLNEWGKAAPVLEEQVRLNPNDLTARNNLAYLYCVELNDAQKALRHSSFVAEQGRNQPNYAYFLDTHGLVLLRLGQLDKAEEALRLSEQLNPRIPDTHLHLAELAKIRGARVQAAEHAERAIVLARETNQPGDDTIRRAEAFLAQLQTQP